MDTTTPSNAPQADDESLTPDQIAMVRVVGLALHPEALPQLNDLMDDYNAMAVAAFVLYVDYFTWVGPSLKDQFGARYMGKFDGWKRCRQALVRDALSSKSWLRNRAEKRDVSLTALPACDERTFRTYLSSLGLKLIDTSESFVLFDESTDQ